MSLTTEQKNFLTETIQNVVRHMHVHCEVAVREERLGDKEVVVAAISAPDEARFLIGKNGQNLQALEHIVRSIYTKKGFPDAAASLSVDVNDYRKSRASHVAHLAHEVVARVRNTQRAEALVPMSPYERRIVHMELASMPDITTESIGQDPQRRIVIKPYRITG